MPRNFQMTPIGFRPDRTKHEQHEVGTSGTKSPHQGKKQRARNTKRAKFVSRDMEQNKNWIGKQSDRQKTVIENGKHIPKLGVKDGNKRVLP